MINNKLQQELDDFKSRMKLKLSEAGFFTRGQVETKYRKLIADKEERLYPLQTDPLVVEHIDQQTQSEKHFKNNYKY